MTEIYFVTRQVRVLCWQRLATGQNRVLRGQRRLCLRSVHRERAGCVMESRKETVFGADVVFRAEGSIGRLELARVDRSDGIVERGMYARVTQEPGRSRALHPRLR